MSPCTTDDTIWRLQAPRIVNNVLNSHQVKCNNTENVFLKKLRYQNQEWNKVCYYDPKLAQKCHKLLRQQSNKDFSCRIVLYPEEEWAQSVPGIQWRIKVNRLVLT